MKNNERGSVIILVVVLATGFFFLLSLSFRGWGYAGYRGYRHGPSFFYMGGPRYYPSSPSVRTGSTGGPSHVGGGVHGGK